MIQLTHTANESIIISGFIWFPFSFILLWFQFSWFLAMCTWWRYDAKKPRHGVAHWIQKLIDDMSQIWGNITCHMRNRERFFKLFDIWMWIWQFHWKCKHIVHMRYIYMNIVSYEYCTWWPSHWHDVWVSSKMREGVRKHTQRHTKSIASPHE